jgi:5-methyltetrahydropteroyltriglutamate--homocysteine methyltransferase
VRRQGPMTVEWASYARSLTDRPVKGMLTGPVTMLQWSFVRDDQPPEDTCKQVALALRQEVADLEAAGVPIIQVDEPGLREGLPLHAEDRARYLAWAVDCFRLATAGARDDTQVHTHMCYAHFDDIIGAVAAMDADVVSFESARAGEGQAGKFIAAGYQSEIGPGIWDVHSPRAPSVEELTGILERLAEVVPVERLWVNPDCGLKTRTWQEVEPVLRNLVAAAKTVRRGHQG